VEFDATLPGTITTLADATETAIGKLTGTRARENRNDAQETAAADALIAVIAPFKPPPGANSPAIQEQMRHAYFIGEGLADDTLGKFQTAAIAIRTAGGHAAAGRFARHQRPRKSRRCPMPFTQYATNITAPGDQKNENAAALETIIANIGKLAGLRASSATGRRTGIPVAQSRRGQHRKSFQCLPAAPCGDNRVELNQNTNMKFEVSERIATSEGKEVLLKALEEQLRSIRECAATCDILIAKSIEASFGSINRTGHNHR